MGNFETSLEMKERSKTFLKNKIKEFYILGKSPSFWTTKFKVPEEMLGKKFPSFYTHDHEHITNLAEFFTMVCNDMEGFLIVPDYEIDSLLTSLTEAKRSEAEDIDE
jgi:hypothetical protein